MLKPRTNNIAFLFFQLGKYFFPTIKMENTEMSGFEGENLRKYGLCKGENAS